jgi:hypothetical protein
MKIEIYCHRCKQIFTRNEKTYRQQQIKRRSLPFCSRSCAAAHRNETLPKSNYSIKHLESIGKIQNWSGNKREIYSPFKYFLGKCRERKRQKGSDFDIDLPYLKNLWEKQCGICPYTGLKMVLPNSTLEHSKCRSLKKASLDRIDPTKGYLRGNVEFVCLIVNFAKNAYSKEDVKNFFLEINWYSRQDSNLHNSA